MAWVLTLVSVALAHIEMDKPSPVTDSLKDGPCGAGDHQRGDDVTVYAPGETIRVRWHETIDHPSTYRIAFDEDGDDSFEDPKTTDDFYVNDGVLLDEIPDQDDGVFSVEVTLPDTPCENCTLQLIQLMLDKPPYEAGTNDLYYQCADIALRVGSTNTTAPVDTASLEGEASQGCACDGSASPGLGVVGLALAVVLGQKRRRNIARTPVSIVPAEVCPV